MEMGEVDFIAGRDPELLDEVAGNFIPDQAS
jgi:hypothetical protein